MKPNPMDLLKSKVCGKKIVSIEPSKWSGEVRAKTENQDYLSIRLEDGTVLEVGRVVMSLISKREGNPR